MRGIYAIRNVINERVYIGKSIHLEKRKLAQLYVDKENIPYDKVVEYSNGAIKKKCLIDGLEYESIKKASDLLGIPTSSLRRRMLSDKFPNYSYLENKNTQQLKV